MKSFSILYLLAVLILVNGCGLFYPALFYDQVISPLQGTNGGGPKSWKTIGNPGLSLISASPSLKVNASGTPFVSHSDGGSNYLQFYNGGGWQLAGYPFAGITETVLALSNRQTPFTFIGNSGTLLQYTGILNYFAGLSGGVTSLSMTFANAGPCVAYVSNNGTGYVQERIGAAWDTAFFFAAGAGAISKTVFLYEPVGGLFFLASHSPGGLYIDSAGALSSLGVARTNFAVMKFDMAVYNNYAYIVYQTNSISDPLYVLGVDTAGNGFTLGGQIPVTGAVSSCAITMDSVGNPYVAIAEGGTLTVKVFTLVAGVWIQVGGDVGLGNNPSIDIAPDGTIYVAFSDSDALPTGAITVKAFK